MLLCEKFQARFGAPAAGTSSLILLNEAAIELSVPRRRLYDIINVLEAVEVMSDLVLRFVLHGMASCIISCLLICKYLSGGRSATTYSSVRFILSEPEAALWGAMKEVGISTPLTAFSAVQIVSRTGKLAYEWRGLNHLPELLDRLVADQVLTPMLAPTLVLMRLCQLEKRPESNCLCDVKNDRPVALAQPGK